MNKKFITPFSVFLIVLVAGQYAPRFASACPAPGEPRGGALSGLIPVSSAAVKQVRVTAERASIYAEPSRTSARIDIVEKGTILNLFQLNKVKKVWYYVSYDSPRYGSRVSGFIQDSYVEPVGAERPQTPKPEERIEQRKAEPTPPPEKPAAPPPKAEAKAAKPEVPPPPRVERLIGLTPIPRGQTFRFPRREPQRQEMAWMPPAPAEKKVEAKAALPLKKEKPPEKGLTEASKESKPPQPQAAPPAKPTVPRIEKEEKPKPEPEAKKEKAKVRPQPEEVERKPQFQPPRAQPSRTAAPRRGPGAFRLGLGYGNSYGGAGGFLQVNIGMGVSLHGGVGMYPTTMVYSGTDWVKNEVLYSAGLKYYLPIGSGALLPYLDLQYGGLRVEAAQIVSGIWESSYVYSHEQKTLQGISFLAGTEMRLGRLGLNGSLGASYSLTEWEFLQQKLFLAFDVGLVVYF
jgi:hypothetical protein